VGAGVGDPRPPLRPLSESGRAALADAINQVQKVHA